LGLFALCLPEDGLPEDGCGIARSCGLLAYSILIILNTVTATEHIMSRTATTTMTVRLSGTLSDFVAANVGEHGAYENVSEYMRDLIRRDKERVEREAFDRLKAELAHAYAAPDSSYQPLTAADVIARNRT
jgi:Arc/MetJ-type ribon-helix-helix transcriptional regulator